MRNRREKAEEIKEKNCQKSNECIDEEDLAKMDPKKKWRINIKTKNEMDYFSVEQCKWECALKKTTIL